MYTFNVVHLIGLDYLGIFIYPYGCNVYGPYDHPYDCFPTGSIYVCIYIYI